MKLLLQQYAAYNIWANQRIFDCINNLADDQINRPGLEAVGLCIGVHEAGVGEAGGAGASARDVEHGERDVDAHDRSRFGDFGRCSQGCSTAPASERLR